MRIIPDRRLREEMSDFNLPIVNDWYDTKSYPNNVTRISEKYIDPYWSGNIWVIKGSEASLIVDTGTGIVSPIPLIESITNTPLIAAASCHYYDHAGGLHYFDRRCSHPVDAAVISDPTNDMGAGHFNQFAVFSALPDKEFKLGSYYPISTISSDLLSDGYIFDLGNRSIEVLHIPGRTLGSLVFWEEKTGNLFGGETVFVDPYLNNFPPENVQSYEDGLKRLCQYPVSTIFGGHFEPFSGKELIDLVGSEIGRYD
jgi:glyoxylase-like metal-dependent hydrolase (beta-lactamase superfamily II)|tara:strand:- start:396 stop:1163 length:768 start_codon:yes stop_codon:yes gene_type:complete